MFSITIFSSDESAQALLSFKNGGMKFELEPEVKMEEDVLGPLGLHRVGEELPPRTTPGLVLNRRGMVRD